MNRILFWGAAPALLLGVLGGGLEAQLTLADITSLDKLHPALKPFRTPDRNIVAPAELYDLLRRMKALARGAKESGRHKVAYDADGREVCDDVEWLKAWDLLKLRMERQAGVLLQVLEESRNVEDRELSMYGAFYVANVEDVFGLIARLPAEPLRQIREANYDKALAFIRAQWAKDSGATGPDGEKLPKYSLNLIPFAALLLCTEPIDQAQGLWFLRECIAVRPQYARSCLQVVAPHLRGLVIAADADVRREAALFLTAIDKHKRKPAGAAPKDAELVAWFDAVTHDLLPPVRRISEGLIDIYPSKDRDDIVRVGREVLENDSIGAVANGKTKQGALYRGFRVARLPAPLDLLPIPIEAVVTTINGMPVSTSKSVLEALEAQLGKAKANALMVEFIEKGHSKAIEFRIVSG